MLTRSVKVGGSLSILGAWALLCYYTPMPWLSMIPIGFWSLGIAWDYFTMVEPRTLNSYTPQEQELMRLKDEIEAAGDMVPREVYERWVRDYIHITGR